MTDDIQTQMQTEDAPTPAAGPVTEERIRQALMQVFDPELGINIVDLGPSTTSICRTTATSTSVTA